MICIILSTKKKLNKSNTIPNINGYIEFTNKRINHNTKADPIFHNYNMGHNEFQTISTVECCTCNVNGNYHCTKKIKCYVYDVLLCTSKSITFAVYKLICIIVLCIILSCLWAKQQHTLNVKKHLKHIKYKFKFIFLLLTNHITSCRCILTRYTRASGVLLPQIFRQRPIIAIKWS